MDKEFDKAEPKYDKVKVEKGKVRTDSYFDGKVMEYIGYKILAGLITAVTLTIAKPWADKLLLEYEINHTVYNGKRLKFEGKGSALFVQRFKWSFFTIITLGIYGLWVPIKKEKWVLSNVHFEDEELKDGDSYFDGGLLGLLGVNIFIYLITISSFGLLFPFGLCYKQKWMAKHSIINCKRIVFDGTALSLIGHYLLYWLITCVTLGLYGLWLPMKIYGWQVKNTHIKLKDEEYEKDNPIPTIIGIVLAILLVITLVLVIPKTNIPEVFSGDMNIKDIFKGSNTANSMPEYMSVEKNSGTKAVNITINNDGGEYHDFNTHYKIGDILNNLYTPTKEGYRFIKWQDSNGTEVKDGYVITSPVEIKAVWEPITTTTAPQQRCEPGYTYVDYDYLCYSQSDYVEPVTVIIGEGTEEEAAGIHCPSGYQITWDISPEGYCFRTASPNW